MKLRTNKFLIALLLVIQAAVLIYFGVQKKGMHFDECFSYFNTNNSVGRQAFDRTYVTSDEIMQDFYVKEGERFNYPYVVELQSYDVHPPVFYLLLHTLCSFFPNIYSMWFGISLNILYALLSTVFLYLIIKEFTGSTEISCGLSLLCAINPGVISNVMYIRMYCLMTLWIMIAVYLHIRMSRLTQMNELPWKYILCNAVLAFLGFMTHYFYLAFIFFLEAGFWLPKLFGWKKNWKGFIKYSLSMLAAGILGILVYPSCLGHVNSGYRGQEVKSYMLDFSDMKERISFFAGLINDYIFDHIFIVFGLTAVLLFVTAYYKMSKTKMFSRKIYVYIECIIIPTLGYYLVSAKGALLGDVTMMRYQLPIYIMVILCMGLMIYGCIKVLFKEVRLRIVVGTIVGAAFLALNIHGIVTQNVNYLYKNQATMESVAKEHSEDACVYIYNDEANKYLLWNDFKQLAEYEKVYFVCAQDLSAIEDKNIQQAEKLVVYISNLNEIDNYDDYFNMIYDSNSNVTEHEKLYEAMYANVYEFK